MATIRREVQISVPSNRVWDAVRDVGALHTRLAPGLVTDTRLDGDSRIVTFANGMALRELIVAVDNDDRRLVWSVVGPPFSHHNGSLQVFDQGGGSRAEWVADLLPHDLKDLVAGIMEQGLVVMKRTLEAEAGGDQILLSDSVTNQQVVRTAGEGQQMATPGKVFGSHSETSNTPEMPHSAREAR